MAIAIALEFGYQTNQKTKSYESQKERKGTERNMDSSVVMNQISLFIF